VTTAASSKRVEFNQSSEVANLDEEEVPKARKRKLKFQTLEDSEGTEKGGNDEDEEFNPLQKKINKMKKRIMKPKNL